MRIFITRVWLKDALLQPESRERYQRLLAQGWTDSVRARLFRHILCLRRGWGRALLSRPANETLGRGKGRARRRKVGRHEDGLNCDFLRREDWR